MASVYDREIFAMGRHPAIYLLPNHSMILLQLEGTINMNTAQSRGDKQYFPRQRSLKAADTPAKEIHCTQTKLKCLVTELLTSITTIKYVVVFKQRFLLEYTTELVSGDLMHFNNKFYFIFLKMPGCRAIALYPPNAQAEEGWCATARLTKHVHQMLHSYAQVVLVKALVFLCNRGARSMG